MPTAGGETTVYDGLTALQDLREQANRCPRHAALLERIESDQVTYVRIFDPPTEDVDAADDNTITTWEPMLGHLSLSDACETATEMGFEATALADGRLRLDYSCDLVNDAGSALCTSISSQHTSIYTQYYRDGSTPALERVFWASDQKEISDEETLLITALYARSRLFFEWQSAGDTVILDNRRFAHGRMPFTGKRSVAAFMGNMI